MQQPIWRHLAPFNIKQGIQDTLAVLKMLQRTYGRPAPFQIVAEALAGYSGASQEVVDSQLN